MAMENIERIQVATVVFIKKKNHTWNLYTEKSQSNFDVFIGKSHFNVREIEKKLSREGEKRTP